jgi:hypothetical protein
MLMNRNLQTADKPRWEITADGILTLVAAKKKAAAEEEKETEDEWEKEEGEEGEEAWDPDFDEFDVPKSRTGKSDTKEEEDLNFEEEEEFNDLFDDEGFDEDAADDDY